jgi:hypothetical protein
MYKIRNEDIEKIWNLSKDFLKEENEKEDRPWSSKKKVEPDFSNRVLKDADPTKDLFWISDNHSWTNPHDIDIKVSDTSFVHPYFYFHKIKDLDAEIVNSFKEFNSKLKKAYKDKEIQDKKRYEEGHKRRLEKQERHLNYFFSKLKGEQ